MTHKDTWQAGDFYEPFMGRWSRLAAAAFIEGLDPHPSKHWLDIGCGTGALTRAILDHADPATVRSVDPAEGFVEHAQQHIRDPRVEFSVADALSLDHLSPCFDYVVSGLVLNFVQDPSSAIKQMRRVARSSAHIAAYVWDYSEGMEMLRFFWDAAGEVDGRAAQQDEAVRFPICRPESLQDLWESAGLSRVVVRPIQIETLFKGFDDYWSPFLGGQGPAPTYVKSLRPEELVWLRQLLRERLPTGPDGVIPLKARAWAVVGATD